MPRKGARLGGCLIAFVAFALPCAQAAAAPPKKAGGVYQVPAKIRSDCSVAVDDKISAWLAGVPDNSTVQFGANRCYGQDATITLSGRRNLVIDGQGSEFRALTLGDSERANWRFVGGGNLTVRNATVRGTNPEGRYQAGFEWQHCFAVEGVQGMTLANVQAHETWGDGVFVWHSTWSPACGDDATSARNVSITGATLTHIGRQGVAVVDGEDVTLQGSTVGPVALAGVDIETDDDCEIARRVTIAGNTFGANSWGVVASVGFGAEPQVGAVTATDNVQTVATSGCFAPVRILSPVDASGQILAYRKNYVFRGNQFLGTRNGFEFRGVDDIDVSSNTVQLPPTTSCGQRAGVLLAGTHNVAITGNVFAGANNVYIVRDPAGSVSGGITSTGNSTG
jgi:hypothetical protein